MTRSRRSASTRRVQLAEAAKIMQRRINRVHLLAGVTMTDPDLVWIGPDVSSAGTSSCSR